jgi:hypothetical protein
MWKVRRVQNGDATVFKLIGRLEGDQLNELQEVLASEASALDLILDLTDVRLVDQDTVRFLADCEGRGARLQNCPHYIREWIEAANTSSEFARDEN